VSDMTVTAASAVSRWHIDVGNRADLVFQLRDYFQRLGLVAKVAGPTLVEVASEEAPEAIEGWVANWAAKRDSPLHLEKLGEPAHVAEPAPVAEPTHVPEPAQVLVAPVPRSGSPRLGTLLVDRGYITDQQLRDALAESKATGDLLGVSLLRSGVIYDEELARALSQQLSIPYISIGRVGVDQSVARLLPAEVGAAAAAIPVRELGSGAIQVAFADPTDSWALAEVGRHLPTIEIVVAELSEIRTAWRNVKGL
jgi:hypothetical protein